MGSAVKESNANLRMVLLGILAITIVAFAIFRFVSGGETKEESLVTPPPREGSKDFGPLPPEHVIGADGAPKAVKQPKPDG